jgi:hypothetical protein
MDSYVCGQVENKVEFGLVKPVQCPVYCMEEELLGR